MKPNQHFIAVSTDEELPKESKEYFTNKGTITFDSENEEWVVHEFGGWMLVRGVGWWLKPITPPTEEEIYEIIRNCETDETDGVHIVLKTGVYPHSYDDLAKSILKLINGER